jgi:hypothetical protein
MPNHYLHGVENGLSPELWPEIRTHDALPTAHRALRCVCVQAPAVSLSPLVPLPWRLINRTSRTCLCFKKKVNAISGTNFFFQIYNISWIKLTFLVLFHNLLLESMLVRILALVSLSSSDIKGAICWNLTCWLTIDDQVFIIIFLILDDKVNY